MSESASSITAFPTARSRPSADALFRLGLSLSTRGGDAQPDPVAAHALFDLAARMGSIEAKVYRREISEEMDPEEIDEARKIANAWLAEA